jgi:hypothetical protein
MKNYLLLLGFLLSLKVGAQLTVGDGSLILSGGSSIQLTNGMTLIPAEDLTITTNHFSQSNTPVLLNGTVSSIQHVVSWTNPLVFTGTVRLYYTASNLNGYSETELKLSYQNAGNWAPSAHGFVNTTGLCVDEVVTAKSFTGLTASAIYVPLPVTLLTFTAKRDAGNTVLVQWQTASESNNSHFIIERSGDGRNYASIGRVAAGSSTGASYSFTDEQPFSGNNYYRLRQHDRNGSQRLYGVRLVQGVEGVGAPALYPNPVVGNAVTVDLKRTLIKPLAYIISNAAGQVVGSGQLTNRQQMVSVNQLPAGYYHLQMGDGQTLSFQKL